MVKKKNCNSEMSAKFCPEGEIIYCFSPKASNFLSYAFSMPLCSCSHAHCCGLLKSATSSCM